MKATLQDELMRLAAKYVWWKTPEEALRMPDRIIAQVMNIGDFDDVQRLASLMGDNALCEVIRHAEAGEFNERSWHYWHYRLGLSDVEKVPSLPVRKLA